MLDQITPVILTYNEDPNIARTLAALAWAKEVLIIDSGSTDKTLTICSGFNNTRVVNRAFDNFANQCNFALEQDIKTEWILSMDADYVVTAELVAEIEQLNPPPAINGYQISFQYLISGKPLRGSLYPPRTALYRKNVAQYRQDGHAHKVSIDGEVSALNSVIQHDDRKPFKRWLKSQWNYAKQEARKLTQSQWGSLSTPDKLRKIGVAPVIIVPYTIFAKGLILNGIPGLLYTCQRLIAEVYLQVARVSLRGEVSNN